MYYFSTKLSKLKIAVSNKQYNLWMPSVYQRKDKGNMDVTYQSYTDILIVTDYYQLRIRC